MTKAQESGVRHSRRDSLGDKDLEAGIFLERSPGEAEK